jgi:hypothetical protein
VSTVVGTFVITHSEATTCTARKKPLIRCESAALQLALRQQTRAFEIVE